MNPLLLLRDIAATHDDKDLIQIKVYEHVCRPFGVLRAGRSDKPETARLGVDPLGYGAAQPEGCALRRRGRSHSGVTLPPIPKVDRCVPRVGDAMPRSLVLKPSI